MEGEQESEGTVEHSDTKSLPLPVGSVCVCTFECCLETSQHLLWQVLMWMSITGCTDSHSLLSTVLLHIKTWLQSSSGIFHFLNVAEDMYNGACSLSLFYSITVCWCRDIFDHRKPPGEFIFSNFCTERKQFLSIFYGAWCCHFTTPVVTITFNTNQLQTEHKIRWIKVKKNYIQKKSLRKSLMYIRCR